MARLANGENIHAVFEHLGQFPHDAAPGAYIGVKANAHLVDFKNGDEIDLGTIAQKLMKPSGPGFQYVLASTEELAVQLAKALRESTKMLYQCSGVCGSEAIEKDLSLQCVSCKHPLIEGDRRRRRNFGSPYVK